MDTARLELPATPAAASVARLFVRCLCEEWGVGAVADVAELLSSELVTNAVLHAHSAIELDAACNDRDLRIDVRDFGSGEVAPHPVTTPTEEEGGRGLAIVANLATSWGVEESSRGKSVWFTLTAPGNEQHTVAQRASQGAGAASSQFARGSGGPALATSSAEDSSSVHPAARAGAGRRPDRAPAAHWASLSVPGWRGVATEA